ncbi:MAG: hypothetical protein AAGI38_08040 [Bacteroidota bacterium]
MKILHVLFLVLLMGCQLVHGQVTGFQGRRLVVKTDLSIPLFKDGYTLEAEYALLRNLSLSVSFNDVSYRPFNFPSEDLFMNTRTVGYTLRIYGQKVYSAPKGVYTFLTYRNGKASGSGRFFSGDFDDLDQYAGEFEIEDLTTHQFEVGTGIQLIYWSFLVLDFNTGLSFGLIPTDSEREEAYVRDLRWANGHILTNGSALRSESDPGSDVTWGINMRLGIGVLLF